MYYRTVSDIVCAGSKMRPQESWDNISISLNILTPDGRPNAGLAYRIIEKGYDPKRTETRRRLGLFPVCPTCCRKMPRAPRIVKFDLEQMDTVVKFLREHEIPTQRTYSRT